MQSTHLDFKKENHSLDIVILCDSLSSPANVGGVLRLADAYGVANVVFLNGEGKLTPRAKSVSRGTQNYVNHEFVQEYIFDERDWFCLELTSNSQSLHDLEIKSNKIGLIIGNENKGVMNDFLTRFPSYHIKMFGNNSSMNVTNALSAALFKLTQ